jgi:thiol:disulfide interchange protein/DsbC/DsbD-like thiol-disulfide interchange protein
MTCMYKTLSTLFFVASCAFSPWAAAQFNLNGPLPGGTKTVGSVVQTEQVRAELVAHAPDGVGPGKPLWLGLKLQHQPEWHTYWKNAGDSGLPTQLQWTLPGGAQAGNIDWPTPSKIAIGRLANFGYEGTVLLPVPLSITPDFKPSLLGSELEVKLFASWLVCRKECIPQEGQFVLRIPIKGSTAINGADFEAARAASPVPLAGPARAQVDANALTLTVSGLPSAWRGKAVKAFPETAEVIETAAAPSGADATTTGTAQRSGTQAWADGVWSASLPLYAYRSTSPQVMPVVLAQGQQSFVVQAVVAGTWPAVAPQATVPAALQQALDANAAANASPNATGSAALLNGGLWWALAAALLGGLILNLMPCVFPVLAIKVLGFANGGVHGHTAHRAQGLAYTAGVVLSFVALGALMLGLRAGGEQLGWGFQLQSPAVIAALALLFTLLGLNMAGLFEVVSLVPNRWASVQLRHPALDAFLSGVLAVAVASPCTAPSMGASLGYAITLPDAQALAIFAALGLGLALPYLLASWVPGVGAWLPRPGVWMVHLRHFMAFLMWATVVWLVWVLGHLSGVDGAASLLALLLSVALVVWSLGLEQRSRWVFAAISIAVCAMLVWAIGKNVLQMEPTPASTISTNFSTTASSNITQGTGTSTGTDGTPQWQAWAPGRVEAELATGKAVFVDFTAAWCITCQYNKKTTLSSPDVLADFQAKQVTLLRADWTRRDPAITQALQALGRSGVPVYVLYKTGRAPVVMSEILSVDDVRGVLSSL